MNAKLHLRQLRHKTSEENLKSHFNHHAARCFHFILFQRPDANLVCRGAEETLTIKVVFFFHVPKVYWSDEHDLQCHSNSLRSTASKFSDVSFIRIYLRCRLEFVNKSRQIWETLTIINFHFIAQMNVKWNVLILSCLPNLNFVLFDVMQIPPQHILL